MQESYLQLTASAVGGSCIATILARAFITKSLKDLETAIQKIAEIRTELATITIKLENFSQTHHLMHELDRKVVALETKISRSN